MYCARDAPKIRPMRFLLRLIAGLTLVSFIGTVGLVIRFYQRGGVLPLIHAGSFGVITVVGFVGWLITLVVGPPAVVLLWKLRDVGRVASVLFWGNICLYYVLCWCLTLVHNPRAFNWAALFAAILNLVPIVLLLSARAQQVCGVQTMPSDTAS